jgi:hypothetical protein
MRDLASVATIDKVWPLEGKDKVQGASMVENGYEAMVSKDIQPGQLVAFIQEGAILPEIDAWEWLRKRCYKESAKGFVIKPMKFATIKSWGLIVPLNELPLDEKDVSKLKAGDDITDMLQIRKYEPEEDASPTRASTSKKAYPKWVKFCLSHVCLRWLGKIWQKRHQNSAGGFPSGLISKSDETTIQNRKSDITKFADSKVVVTGKMEGQSFTVVPVFQKSFLFKKTKLVGAYPCSRNNAYTCEDSSLFWDMMRKYDVVKKMKAYFKETGTCPILQGEQVGPGIQDNIYDFKENYWYLYEVKDYFTLDQGTYEDQVKIADKFGMRVVPLLWTGTLKDIMPDLESAVAFAEKAVWTPAEGDTIHSWLEGLDHYKDDLPEDKLWKAYMQHEGVVVRTTIFDKDKNIGTSFKVKNFQYDQRGRGKIHNDCVNFKKS